MQRASESWQCPQCTTTVDADFDVCWRCGAAPDGQTDPAFQAEVERIQDRVACQTCGYLLRGLVAERCPECGAPFDAEAVDTIDQGATLRPPTTTPAQQRQWTIATLVAWLALLTLGLIANNAEIPRAWERPFDMAMLASVLASVTCSARLLVLMFRPIV